ncbi:MAG TPA: hypothetical protein VNU72_10760 [Puia sp.]|nr:hypothetical protein [Puia sp.]
MKIFYLSNYTYFGLQIGVHLRPDYPFKVFFDKRNNYVLLMETLATDSRLTV